MSPGECAIVLDSACDFTSSAKSVFIGVNADLHNPCIHVLGVKNNSVITSLKKTSMRSWAVLYLPRNAHICMARYYYRMLSVCLSVRLSLMMVYGHIQGGSKK